MSGKQAGAVRRGEHASIYIFRKERVRREGQRRADAASKEALVAQLRRERIVPGPVRQKGKEFSMPTFGSGKVSTKDIAIFFRQFSVMIDAGFLWCSVWKFWRRTRKIQLFRRR